jgi:hypothetical protein
MILEEADQKKDIRNSCLIQELQRNIVLVIRFVHGNNKRKKAKAKRRCL